MSANANRQLPKPVNFDQLYPGRFLKSGELLGEKRTFTIETVEIDELEGEKGKKIQGVISFKETKMQLLLNKTNGQCIKAMFGKKLSAWEGKRITLYPDLVRFGPDMVDGIRIWGSPDIPRNIEAIVSLPRRKPTTMTMHLVMLEQLARSPGMPSAPTIADYDACQTREAFDALEKRRQEHWNSLAKGPKKELKDASDRAGQRLTQSTDRTPYTRDTAIAALRACADDKARADVWSCINADFELLGEDVPLEVEAVNNEMKESFAQL